MLLTWRLPERGAERPRVLLCSGCGALLPAADSTEVMLGKRAQLARFGLDAEGSPLLGPASEDS